MVFISSACAKGIGADLVMRRLTASQPDNVRDRLHRRSTNRKPARYTVLAAGKRAGEAQVFLRCPVIRLDAQSLFIMRYGGRVLASAT
ncbi:MAG: hypothetical protein QOK24_1969 [Verrucomicrobiota bacterium]